MKYNFIKTTDKSTAEKLLEEGFQLASCSGQVFVFINEHPKGCKFEDIDKTHIVYSNMLAI